MIYRFKKMLLKYHQTRTGCHSVDVWFAENRRNALPLETGFFCHSLPQADAPDNLLKVPESHSDNVCGQYHVPALSNLSPHARFNCCGSTRSES